MSLNGRNSIEQVQNELTLSEAMCRSLFDTMKEGIGIIKILFDSDGIPNDFVFLAVNPAYEVQTGLRAEEVVGKKVSEVLPVVEPIWYERYGGVIRTQMAKSFEEYNVSLNRWFRVSASPLPEKDCLAAVFEDITDKTRAEEALKKANETLEEKVEERSREMADSEERFRTLAEASPAAVVVYRGGKSLYMNKAAETILGYTRDNLMSMDLIALVHPDQRYILRGWARRREAGDASPARYEVKVCTKSGEERWVDVSSRLFIYNGLPAGLMMFFDITDRKRVEENLQRSEQMLKIVLDHFPGVVYWKDRNSVYLGANRESARIVGFVDPSEYVGKTDYDMPWAATEAEAYRADDRQVMESGQPKLHVIESQRRADGGMGWLDTSKVPLRDADGNVIGVLGVSIDITERKRAEDALKDSEARFRSLIEEAPVAIAISCDGLTIYANPRYLNMFGISNTNQLYGRPFTEQIAPEDRDRAREFAMKFASGHHDVWESELMGLRMNGSHLPFHIAITTVMLEGRPAILGFFSDITDRMKAEEELVRSNAELQQFAYVASHDLKEPLRMVSMYLDLLEDRYSGKTLDGKAEEYMRFAMDGAKRMSLLIDDLLAYSRIETRGKTPKLVDMNEVLATVCKDLDVSIRESGASVTSDGLPEVLADRTQMVLLLQNLVGNAIKFRSDKQPRVEVSAVTYGGEYIFSVKDNGIGIDPKYAEKLFKMFQRLHTREEYPGTGIGLAVSKKIVERLGGRIWFESEPGEGTTFYFTIPV